MYACLAVTCHLHFWQNDRGLLRATAVTRLMLLSSTGFLDEIAAEFVRFENIEELETLPAGQSRGHHTIGRPWDRERRRKTKT